MLKRYWITISSCLNYFIKKIYLIVLNKIIKFNFSFYELFHVKAWPTMSVNSFLLFICLSNIYLFSIPQTLFHLPFKEVKEVLFEEVNPYFHLSQLITKSPGALNFISHRSLFFLKIYDSFWFSDSNYVSFF